MKKILSFVLLVFGLIISFERLSETQTEPGKTQSEQDKRRPKIIVHKSGEPNELPYDAGAVRFLASSEDTNGAWSL